MSQSNLLAGNILEGVSTGIKIRTGLPLPTELIISVFSYLGISELKSFSRCSSHCRESVTFLLYTHIFLSISSLEAFQDGNLNRLGRYVRHITFANLAGQNVNVNPRLALLYATHLDLFPNLKSLRVPFHVKEARKLGLIDELFSRLWCCAVYQRLESISLECLGSAYPADPRIGGGIRGAMAPEVFDTLKLVGLESFEPLSIANSDVLTNREDTKLPAALTEVHMTVKQLTMKQKFARNTLLRNPFLLLRSARMTLKKLTITSYASRSEDDLTGYFDRGIGEVIVYEGLQELGIKLLGRNRIHKGTYWLEGIGKRCPNLEVLDISGCGNFVGLIDPGLVHMKKLRKLAFPWMVWEHAYRCGFVGSRISPPKIFDMVISWFDNHDINNSAFEEVFFRNRGTEGLRIRRAGWHKVRSARDILEIAEHVRDIYGRPSIIYTTNILIPSSF